MFLEIIFLVLVIIGIRLLYKYDGYNEGNLLGGWLLIIIFGISLIINTVNLMTVSYYFDVYEKQMQAHQETLDNVRANEFEFETATIALDIISVNKNLARYKRENQSWFYDIYVDDRIDSIKPIK